MGKKLIEKEITIKVPVEYMGLDALVARLTLGEHDLIKSNRRLDIPASEFPEDFEPARFDISGECKIKIVIKEKADWYK